MPGRHLDSGRGRPHCDPSLGAQSANPGPGLGPPLAPEPLSEPSVLTPTPSPRCLIPQEAGASVSSSCHWSRPWGWGGGAAGPQGIAVGAGGRRGPGGHSGARGFRLRPSFPQPRAAEHSDLALLAQPWGGSTRRPPAARPSPPPGLSDCRPPSQPHSLVRGHPAQVRGCQAVAALLPGLLASHLLQREPGLVQEAGTQLIGDPRRARQRHLQCLGPVLLRSGQGPREETLHLASVHGWRGEATASQPVAAGST